MATRKTTIKKAKPVPKKMRTPSSETFHARLATLSGPGVTEVNAVAAVLRRTASMPLVGSGLLGGVRQRVIEVEADAKGEATAKIGPALVFSEPHLKRRESLVNPDLAATQNVLKKIMKIQRLVSESTPAGISTTSAADTAENATAAPARTKEEIDSLISSLDLALKMESDSGDPVVSRFQALVGDLLGTGVPARSALNLSESIVDSSSMHDFSQYVFGREPSTLINVTAPATVQPPVDLDDFLVRVQRMIETVVYAYCQSEQDVGAGYFSISFTQYFPGFVESIFRLFSTYVGTPIFTLYRSLIPGYTGSSGDVMNDVLGAFEKWLIKLCRDTGYTRNDIAKSFDNPTYWETAADEIITIFNTTFPAAQTTSYLAGSGTAYDFKPYAPGVINFGLRLVYRQTWRPIGNQTGEIVRTIPLGPKQSEKVSFKSIINRKESRSSEDSTSTESSQEGATSIKDSSEVVREASDKFKWHVDADAGVNYGVMSAKLSAGLSDETSSNSKDTKLRLNDSMSKTASKMRRDTKVIVTTETSSTDETMRSSEIVNPNDEIAITYVYSKLQRQYDVFTELAEVNSVVFVPEIVPPFSEVNANWVRRNASSLLRVLLDPMYDADIRQVVMEPDSIDLTQVDNLVGAREVHELLKAAKTGIGQLASSQAQYVPDFVGSSVDAHMRNVSNARAKESDTQRRAYRRASLYEHLRKNILHYCRAIWADEDRDQRWLRYSQWQVPTKWVHDGIGGTSGSPPYRDGRFHPLYTSDSMRPLTEVISPAGPIGYIGNYAIFLMQGSPMLANMNEALIAMRSHYVAFTVEVDPISNVTVLDAVAFDPISDSSDYRITYTNNKWSAELLVTGGSVVVTAEMDGNRLDIDAAVRLWFDGNPANNATAVVRVRGTEALEDPERRLIRMTRPLPTAADAPLRFTAQLLEQMASFLPDVAIALNHVYTWNTLTDAQKETVRRRYHDFLLVRNSTVQLALDTNNLVLDLDVGQTPALETFKRLHRYIDVLKELEERLRRRLENVRRIARVQDGNLADPDIERVTVVGDGSNLSGLVDAFDEDQIPSA